jgi:hypothetical protein
LNNNINQLNLIDIYRTFHPKSQNAHTSQPHVEHSPG